jgi:hypothetical protein
MTDLTVASGEIRTTTQSVAGDGGKINVQVDGYVINSSGAGIFQTSTGPKLWDIKIDGSVQSAGGNALELDGFGVLANVTVGINGTLFGGGLNASAIQAQSPINIKNQGSIWSQDGTAILLSGTSSAAFKIVNTADGLISGPRSAIVTNPGLTGNITFENAGIINGLVRFYAGNVTAKNSRLLDFLGTGNGDDTVTNTGVIDRVSLSGGSNVLNNMKTVGGYDGGTGKDSVKNTGQLGDVFLYTGINTLANSKPGKVGTLYANDVVGILTSNMISNAGEIESVRLNLTTGSNTIANSGVINGDVLGGIGNDTVKNSKEIHGDVKLGAGDNNFSNSGVVSGTYLGGAGVDVVTNTGRITVAVDLGGGNDFYSGGKLRDAVKDGNGLDVVKLGAGDDAYLAGGSTDTLTDTIDGGAGVLDSYSVQNFATAVKINLDSVDHVDVFTTINVAKNTATSSAGLDIISHFEYVTCGNAADLVFGNAAANYMSGGDGNDTLYGLAGNDQLFGSNNDDKIIGGLGKDRLTGGSHSDKFYYLTLLDSGNTASTRDVIVDFVTGVDDIVVTDIDANALVAGDQNFTFLAGANADFTGAAGQIRYLFLSSPAAGGFTLVQGDVNGDQIADFSIELTGHVALVAGDFLL